MGKALASCLSTKYKLFVHLRVPTKHVLLDLIN